MVMIPSLHAHSKLRATMSACSWENGWRALLLREYLDQPNEDRFTTAATPDHLFVLVVGGSCRIESLQHGQWRSAHYQTGSLAMTPPGVESTLRWRSTETHRTLQLHLPFALLTRQSQELWDRDLRPGALPALLSGCDQLISSTLLALHGGLQNGLPNLYAESAAELLGMHLLLHHCKRRPPGEARSEDRRLQRVMDYMRANLGRDVSLQDLSQVAGLSRFHLLRVFKRHYGEAPLQRLTRLRMDKARECLMQGESSVGEIAKSCGYSHPANFAVAFRRCWGVSPGELLPVASRRGMRATLSPRSPE
jgi:AraC family transcriptional regulator